MEPPPPGPHHADGMVAVGMSAAAAQIPSRCMRASNAALAIARMEAGRLLTAPPPCTSAPCGEGSGQRLASLAARWRLTCRAAPCLCRAVPVRLATAAGEQASIWSFNYFFYNRKMKRILYFSCRAVSKTAADEVGGWRVMLRGGAPCVRRVFGRHDSSLVGVGAVKKHACA